MKRTLALEFSRVTEIAALAGFKYLGKGNKDIADGAATEAMRYYLNTMEIDGTIVIGEGEIDEAPMLYIGEQVGLGGPKIDIAVDPIEGTRMVAQGQYNALAVILGAEEGSLLNAPDMYMEKLIVNPKCRGAIDLDLPLAENIHAISSAMNKPINELVMVCLYKPRHLETIRQVQAMGVTVLTIPDGDVAASVLTCMPNGGVDFMYTIGGAPEGVVTAGVIRALGGDMHARLVLRKDVYPEDDISYSVEEERRCHEMGVEPYKKLTMNDLCSSDDVVFSATGITKGDLLDGIQVKNGIAETETLLIRGKSRTIRRIRSQHFLNRKDQVMKDIIL